MASSPMPVPALPPPPGVTPDFLHPMSIIKWDIVCVTVCVSVATILLALRIYVRAFIKRQWILEDYMCCMSWAGLITYCTTVTVAFVRHAGVHEWNLTVPQVEELSFLFNTTSIEYSPTILFTKLAVLLLYRRVFSPQRWGVFDLAIQTFMVVITLFYGTTTLIKVWECIPRARIWDRSIPGTCLDISKILNASGTFNTVSDVLILLVPVKAVWNLQMKRKRKAAVIAVFTVGSIAPVFSMVGLVVRFRASSSPDTAYNTSVILLWAAAEISTGICCVCLPTLAALPHHRRRRPSASILKHHSAHTKRQALSLDQWTTHDNEYIELEEAKTHTIGVVPANAVVTEISGGAELTTLQSEGSMIQDLALRASREHSDRRSLRLNIMKTVGIEQSYV